MRRQFLLPETDVETLAARGLVWETIVAGGHWLILRAFPLPPGYNVSQADVALCLSNGYPDAALDMAYFFPLLTRTDGKAINNLTPYTLDGKIWQQWSRHRSSQNPWRPGVDDLSTHLSLVEHWLSREFELR